MELADLDRAIQKIESGRTDEGIDELKRLQDESNDETLLYQIAQIYARYGFLEEAAATARKLLRLSPNDAEFILFCAECLIELGNDLEALELLQSIRPDSGHYLSSLLMLADLYQSQGLEEVAERKLIEAHDIQPEEPVIWYALAEFYRAQGNHYKASLFYEKLMNDIDFASDENVQLHFAESLSMLGEFEKALPYFQKGLQSEKDLDGLFRYGYTAYRAEEYDKAIDIFNELQTLDPYYSTLYPMLANAYEKLGNTKKAIETLEQGLIQDEQNEALYYKLSKLLLESGQKEKAEHYLKKSFALNSPTIEAAQLYLSHLKEEQRYDDMIAFIHELKERHDDHDPILDWELAEAYEKIEDFEKANEYFEASYPFLKDNSEFLERYGYFLLEEGQTEKAIASFSKAVSIDKNLFHLEELIADLENRLI